MNNGQQLKVASTPVHPSSLKLINCEEMLEADYNICLVKYSVFMR